MKRFLVVALVVAAPSAAGCLVHERPDQVDAAVVNVDAATAPSIDAARPDAGAPSDAEPADAGLADAGPADAGLADAGPADAGLADAGVDSAALPDAALCSERLPSRVRFEPPLPERLPVAGAHVRWLGYEHDGAEDSGRVHLDVCDGGPSPCPVDLVIPHIGDALASIRNATGMRGTLDTDGADYADVHLEDDRRCAGCGGRLELLAGILASGRITSIAVHPEQVLCSSSCSHIHATLASAGGTTVVATAGVPVVGPLLVSIASDYAEADFAQPCSLCDCDRADERATGVIAWTTGVFVPGS